MATQFSKLSDSEGNHSEGAKHFFFIILLFLVTTHIILFTIQDTKWPVTINIYSLYNIR